MKAIVGTATAFAIAASLFSLPGSAASGAQFGSWGVDLSAMDRSVEPGDDFAEFVNGTWLAHAVIPKDRSVTGPAADIQILTERRLRALVAALEARPYDSLDGDGKKLRDLYDSYLDRKAIDAAGLAPAKQDLAFINGLKTLDDVAAAMGRPALNLASPLSFGILVDLKDSTRYDVAVGQSGLGMARDYYLRDDQALAAARDAYRKYLARMFALAGIGGGERRAAAVYELEHALAQVQWSDVENRDPDKMYNPMSFGRLKAMVPEFPWDPYAAALGIPLSGPHGERRVIVAQLSAVPKIAKIFAATPVAVWRDYLTVHYLDTYSAYLPMAFDEAHFAFYGTVLGGRNQQLPRATRAAGLLDGRLTFALGKLYVAKYFPPEAERKIVTLVNNLIAVYDEDIRALTWMTSATREKALEKLHKMSVQVGYPAHWRDYSALDIRRGDLLGDIERANDFEWHRLLARLDEPVDRTEWPYGPQEVNAGNNNQFNAIVFPAAFLQPPFFDPRADDAVNYGAIGSVIGHEISHSFDDQGSKFGPAGGLQNWWAPADRAAFDAKAKSLGAQYDAYEPLPGLHVNGALTMGENIADNGGAAVALKAYHLSLAGKAAPVLDGFTGDQRFYLAFGQSYRSKIRDGALRSLVLSDVHTPDAFRVIGVTRNQDAWYAAFGVKPADKYYLAPDRRVHIW